MVIIYRLWLIEYFGPIFAVLDILHHYICTTVTLFMNKLTDRNYDALCVTNNVCQYTFTALPAIDKPFHLFFIFF